MKTNKRIQNNYNDDDEPLVTKKIIEMREKRRPVKNWTKAWQDHAEEYDELESFHK